MKKIGKKIAAMLCMMSAAIPNNIKAMNSGSYNISNYSISSNKNNKNNKKHEQMFEKAKDYEYLKFLSGYTTKKIKISDDNSEKEIVTGKIEFVPIGEEYFQDWMRIFDCSDEESREYLKYWVNYETSLNNDSMKEDFETILKANPSNFNPNDMNFMIKFYELDKYNELSKTEEEIENDKTKIKFREPKVVGHIYLHLKQDNNFMSGYVIDKNFQGRGIATKSLKLVTELGIKLRENGSSSAKSIVMYIVDANIGSNIVAKRCGFVDVGAADDVACVPKKCKVHKWVKKLDSNSKTNYVGYGLSICGGVIIVAGVIALLRNNIKKLYQNTKIPKKNILI